VSSKTQPTLRQSLRNARKVSVTCHHSPDGDAMAAMLGLSASLRLARWDVSVISPSPVPKSYQFLPGWDDVAVYRQDWPDQTTNPDARDALLGADVIVCLDCSDLERLGSLYTENKAKFEATPVVNIDHHTSNTDYGRLNLVDRSAGSVCEYLTLLMEQEDLPITLEIANALLVGIVADTIGFRTGATTARSLKVAASLMERGASLWRASQAVFNTRSATVFKLWGRVLSRAQVDGPLVSADVTREMLAESGATMEDADSLVEFIAGVPGTSGAFLFSEQDGRVRVSMRTSANLNAAVFARSFGGGGHPRAAGFSLDGSIADAQKVVLQEARRRLDLLASQREGHQETDA
jgi:phosphoesterase RecJ-like protein